MPNRAASSATRRATAAGAPARVGPVARHRPRTRARSTDRSPARTNARAGQARAGRARRAPTSNGGSRAWRRTSARRCARWVAAAKRRSTPSNGCPVTTATRQAAGPNPAPQPAWSRSASAAKACARPPFNAGATRLSRPSRHRRATMRRHRRCRAARLHPVHYPGTSVDHESMAYQSRTQRQSR